MVFRVARCKECGKPDCHIELNDIRDHEECLSCSLSCNDIIERRRHEKWFCSYDCVITYSSRRGG